ncbi:MAG TPA: hypothetical protein VFL28_00705 [bacterium]|nr:hypothetical protein [bacterium]
MVIIGRARLTAAAWGIAAAAVYLVAAPLAWHHVPARLLYEGEAPPAPYHWIAPPPDLARDNQPPTGGTGQIGLNPTGSGSASILTDDAQAGIIFPHDSVAPRPGVTAAIVRITAVDPAKVAPPPPGLVFDGNAYRVDAAYQNDGAIVLRRPVTPVLRYPRHATVLLRWSDGAWTALDSKRVPAALQIFAASDRLGVFVAAGPGGGGSSRAVYAIGAAAALLAAAAVIWMIRPNRRKGTRRGDGPTA